MKGGDVRIVAALLLIFSVLIGSQSYDSCCDFIHLIRFSAWNAFNTCDSMVPFASYWAAWLNLARGVLKYHWHAACVTQIECFCSWYHLCRRFDWSHRSHLAKAGTDHTLMVRKTKAWIRINPEHFTTVLCNYSPFSHNPGCELTVGLPGHAGNTISLWSRSALYFKGRTEVCWAHVLLNIDRFTPAHTCSHTQNYTHTHMSELIQAWARENTCTGWNQWKNMYVCHTWL